MRATLSLPKDYNFRLTAGCYALPWIFDGKILRLPIGEDIAYIEETPCGLSINFKRKLRPKELTKLRFYLGLDEDLSEFYHLCQDDPLLYSVPQTLKGLHLRCMDFWDALLVAILQQNASFTQGWGMVRRLFQRFGRKEGDFIFTPSAKVLLANKDKLSEAGIGYRREAVVNVSKAYLENYFEGIEGLSDEEAILHITRIKGVGEYTAKVAMLFSQRRYTIFPLDRWFARLLPVAYPKGEIEYAKDKWGRWIGLFAYFVTVVTEASMIKRAQIKVKERRLSPNPDAPYPTPLSFYKIQG